MIILIGPAGAGKSMQGHKLADEQGYAYLSTGELFRVLITGRRRSELIEGKLLSDDEVINVVDKILELTDVSEEFVLDGFPRTRPQADWLMQQHQQGRFSRPVVINLKISEAVVKERLKTRGRPDDTAAAISQRFESYRSQTEPLIDYLAGQGLVIHDIDADRSPDAVHEEIMDVLGLN